MFFFSEQTSFILKVKEKGFHFLKLEKTPTSKEKKPWWVLKAKEGVKFKPFSSRGISLDILGQAYLVSHGSSFFESSVKNDILERAKKNLPAVIGSPFINILEEEHGTSFVKKAIKSHLVSLNNVDEIGNWLRYAGVYLNQSEIRYLIPQSCFPSY